MSVGSRSTSNREQLLLDWFVSVEFLAPPKACTSSELSPPHMSGEAEGCVMPKLSPGAAAISHAHLPPPDIDRYVETPSKAASSEATTHSQAHPVAEDRHPGLVQVLPWDFRTSFPQPLEEAIEAGKLHEDDAIPENLKALHQEHAQHALILLSDLDAVLDARRLGVDPHTGKPAKNTKHRERLENLFRNEPTRIEHEFEVLMDVYEEAFGAEATDAFRKAIRAWHAGIEVVTEHLPALSPRSASVEAGVFGRKEDGEVVNPSEEEVADIAERMTDQLFSLPDGPQRQALLSKCAEDFGEEAAGELDRWSRLRPEADGSPSASYDPAHPWHYYHEGDGADPLPVDAIPARAVTLEHFGVKWPKNSTKRRALMEQMLDAQQKQLAQDEERYQKLITNGVDALSRYDREIAHGGNDKLAWASAVALKYAHISGGRGRIRCLEEQLAGHRRK